MSDRDEYDFSNQGLLCNANESSLNSDEEKALLAEYKKITKQIEADQNALSETRRFMQKDFSYSVAESPSMRKSLQELANQLAMNINQNDRKLRSLESTPTLKSVLEREKLIAFKIEEERGREALAKYREQEAKKQEELLRKYQESRQEATKKRQQIESNYQLIDTALTKEKSLREASKKDIAEHREVEMNRLIKMRWILFATWAIVVSLLTTIIYFAFSCDSLLSPVIISTIIVSPIVMYYLSSVTEERVTEIHTYGRMNEIQAERDIVRMYTELLHNVDIYEFLGIPSSIKFDEHDLPYNDGTNHYSQTPFGPLTRYIAPSSGTRYHITRGCSGAYSPIHIYNLALNDFRQSWRQFSPCNVCIGPRDSITVPQWYVYYLKVTKITNQYAIKADYRKQRGI